MSPNQNGSKRKPPTNLPILKASNNALQKKLIELPETGMGYQIVTATIETNCKDTVKDDFLVVNCMYFLPLTFNNQNFLSFYTLIQNQVGILQYENAVIEKMTEMKSYIKTFPVE